MTFDVARERHHLVVSISSPLDLDEWDELLESILAEQDRGASVILLPETIATVAAAGNRLYDALVDNLRQRGLTVIRS